MNKLNSNDLFSVNLSRRSLIKALMLLGLGTPAISGLLQASALKKNLKTIPSSGEQIPVIGIGTSRTFDAIDDKELLKQLKKVLHVFFNNDGTLIDSSPMYGSSEAVIGKLLKQIDTQHNVFAATKVWTDGKENGIRQMEVSRELWGIKNFDLMQIHNLRDWEIHYTTLMQMKEQGKIRYIGVTTSHGRSHKDLETLLKTHAFDFLQLSYNITNREVEKRILPIASDRGIAVIVNRPYQRGELFSQVKGKKLPGWAKEIDVTSWGQYFLKFIVSHPAVTCSIPATSKVKHMLDNMTAQFGSLPDKNMRQKMIRYFNYVS